MSKTWKVVIVVALVLGVGAILALKKEGAVSGENGQQSISQSQTGKNLPRLIDLGADKCIPCKMMAPILEELKAEYKGRLEVTFIDVWQSPEKVKEYGLQVIPTQIFIGPDGKELFRHEGFFSKEEIMRKWLELGFTLGKG